MRVCVCAHERDPAMTFDPKCLLKKAHVSIAKVPGLTLVLRCHGYCIYYWYLKHAVFGGGGACVCPTVFLCDRSPLVVAMLVAMLYC